MKFDLSKYRMAVLHDHGVYLHMCGYLPGTRIWSFSVVTWPHHLAIRGDLGNAMFSAYNQYVLPLFTPFGSLSYEYLAEKAELAGSSRVWSFSADEATQSLLDCHGDSHPTALPRLIADLDEDMTAEEYGEVVESHGLRGVETYEVLDAGRIIDPRFKRLCDAVAWARQQYVAAHDGGKKEIGQALKENS